VPDHERIAALRLDDEAAALEVLPVSPLQGQQAQVTDTFRIASPGGPARPRSRRSIFIEAS
jgi:hypothetical protein